MSTQLLERIERPAAEYPAAAGYPRVNHPRIVRTAPRRYLAIDGTEAPGGPEFEAAMAALFPAAYSLSFRVRERGPEAHVGPVEALWQRRNGAEGWSVGEEAFEPKAWRWTLLLAVPDGATDAEIDDVLAARHGRQSPALDSLRVIELDEGLAVEAMHIGPYASEPETLEAMRVVAEESGLEPIGSHHEIYLGDPRRIAPDRLRTVLRQPVRPRR